jgi:hypothetical protein
MLELLPALRHDDTQGVSAAARAPRRMRRHAPVNETPLPTPSAVLASMLDKADYGMLLVTEDLHVLHANPVARAELDRDHPLQLLGRVLRVRSLRDLVPLHQALSDACLRGLRSTLALGEATQRLCLAVVPVPLAVCSGSAAFVMLGKPPVSAPMR